ncbi:MAG: hypothetical protein L3J76_00585, partial [Candidatus Hydrothermae bacterium]|nr:hypothetical protein [Candidatus Hydrothermae bacterium]
MRMFLIALLALMSSASRCFRDPCEGKWSDASSFDVRGVEWVGNKAGVLGVFTKREKCPNLLGYTYRTLYSRDVMFFVDPSTIHQDENGWWIVEADSVWIIHQEPTIEGGGYLRKDPKGRGWWVASDISTGKVLLYDSTFSHILLSINGGGIAFFPSGDSILFGRDDTLR